MNTALTAELWSAFEDHVFWVAAALLLVAIV